MVKKTGRRTVGRGCVPSKKGCVPAESSQRPQKIDIGCGPRKQPGFFGVDIRPFEGVDLVHDLGTPWPFDDESSDEIHCSHLIEHFDALDRAHVINEMYRVLVPGGKATLIAPYGFSDRAYGDPTHKWPPVTGFWFFYLSRQWRDENAPHCNDIYRCDFETTWGYSMHPDMAMRSQETQQFAMQWYVNVIMDIHATMIKK